MFIFLFALLGCVWGGSFVAIKIAVDELSPFWSATFRIGFALFFFVCLYLPWRKPFSVERKLLWKVWITGLFMLGFPFALLFWGEQSIAPGLAGILNGTVPLWTFALGLLFLRSHEPFSLRKLLGLLIGLCGILLIFFPRLRDVGLQSDVLGVLAILGMAVCYGIGTLCTRYLLTGSQNANIYGMIFQQHVSSFAFLLALAFLAEGFPSAPAPTQVPAVVGALIYLGLFSNVLAWLIFSRLIRDWGAVRATAVTYLVPLAALFLDWLFLQNFPRAFELAGAAVILPGVFLIQSARRAAALPKAV